MPETGQRIITATKGAEKARGWPLYFAEQLYVGNPKSTVAICTLWSRKESVLGKLDPKLYSVIGNLYTFDGINYIIKNTLANPYVRSIILFGADMMKTGEALMGLVQDGVEQDNKIKGTNAFVEEIIPSEGVRLFRSNVKIYDLRKSLDLSELTSLVNRLNTEGSRAPFSEPRYIISEGRKVEVLDTEDVGFLVKGKTISQVWLRVIDKIMKFGEDKDTEFKVKEREVLNMHAVITGDEERVPEFLPGDAIRVYVDEFFNKQKPLDVAYTYGSRLFAYPMGSESVDQIAAVEKKLKEVPYTRRAISVTWDMKADMNSNEPPCLLTVVWNYKNGRLHETATFRSHDMYRAWPLNAYALRELQRRVAKDVGMAVGTLNVISNSAHIYEDCWAAAEKTVSTYFKEKPVIVENDVRGYFLITVNPESKEITVQHVRNDGKKSKYVFTGTKPEEILKRIANEGLTLDVYHNMYLGKEVQRAFEVLKSGKTYVQDAA